MTKDSLITDQLREGEALFSQGKIEAAENHFRSLLKQAPEDPDILNNLGVISHAKGNIEEAIDHFTKSLQIDPYNKDALVNYSELLKDLGLAKEIEPIISNAVERFPEDQELCSLLNESRAENQPKSKIGVFCLPGLQSFLGDIVAYLNTKYDVRTCYSNNEQEIESVVRWADIVWLEWANELAIHISNKVPSVSQKQVICRIHSYEVLSGYLTHIQWSKISKSIFVSDHVLKIALEVCPSISQLTEPIVINNGVNLKKFQFKERKPGYNIAVVGHINHKKNPSMWIEILSRLMQIDERYTLKVAGQFQELRYKYYMESLIPKLGLTNNIHFFGQVENIPQWFESNNINYLLSTSPFESFGYSIAEAMAMGYCPLIHAFPGSESIWPRDCLFGCADELMELLKKWQSYDSMKYRRFIEEKYSLDSQLKKIELLLNETASRISHDGPSSESKSEKETRAQQSSTMPISHVRYNKPDRNFIVTGIPRSGTSLFSTLINSFENAVCLNEILYDVDSLPSAFAEIRRRIAAGEPIPNRYSRSGELTTDTQQGGVNVEDKIIENIDENIFIGSKVNIPYLNQIHKILDYGYKVFAMVRDPVYTLGSWNSNKASIIPEAHVTDGDMHPRWQKFNFTTDDKIERQAQIWNFYANLIWSLKERIKIYTYELLTSDQEWVLQDVCKDLGVEPSKNQIVVSTQNIDSKYPEIEKIKEAVRKYCPIKDVFAYSYLDYEEPESSRKIRKSEGKEDLVRSNKEQTTWSRDINYSKKSIMFEKGDDPSHLIIAFGGIAQQFYMPPFEFFNTTNSLVYSRILVRDFNQSWYHLGIDQNITSFDAVLKKLYGIIEELSPETICTVGTSAGGYAALVFGHFLNVDYVQALAPQTFIDKDNRNRIGEKRWIKEIDHVYVNKPKSSWFYDLNNLLQKHNGKTDYYIHVCKNCHTDLSYVQHVENLPRMNILRYDCDSHNIGRYLKNCDILVNLLKKPSHSYVKALNSQSLKTKSDRTISREEDEKLPDNRKTSASRRKTHGRQENTLEDFRGVETYVFFIGYPRSGHSLIGSLLDAHPNIIIAHELDAFKFVEEGCDRKTLFQMILNNSKAFTKSGRHWTGYSYEVPNQWHGKFTELKVIGDKKGGRSVWRLRSEPNLYWKLQNLVNAKVKIIHVVRNPFDNISTIFKKEIDKGIENAIEFYLNMLSTVAEIKKEISTHQLYELSLESFIAHPKEHLAKLCTFLGVDSLDKYLEDCASIIFSSPRRTRESVEWSQELIRKVQNGIKNYPFLSGYSYAS